VSDAPVQTSPAQTYKLSNDLICHQRILLLCERFEDQLVNRRQISASALQVEKPVDVPPFLSISGAHAGCHVAEKGKTLLTAMRVSVPIGSQRLGNKRTCQQHDGIKQ
jgi:hypothetical protein